MADTRALTILKRPPAEWLWNRQWLGLPNDRRLPFVIRDNCFLEHFFLMWNSFNVAHYRSPAIKPPTYHATSNNQTNNLRAHPRNHTSAHLPFTLLYPLLLWWTIALWASVSESRGWCVQVWTSRIWWPPSQEDERVRPHKEVSKWRVWCCGDYKGITSDPVNALNVTVEEENLCLCERRTKTHSAYWSDIHLFEEIFHGSETGIARGTTQVHVLRVPLSPGCHEERFRVQHSNGLLRWRDQRFIKNRLGVAGLINEFFPDIEIDVCHVFSVKALVSRGNDMRSDVFLNDVCDI